MKAQKALVLPLIAVASLNPGVKIYICYFDVLIYIALVLYSMWMSSILVLFAASSFSRVSLYGSLITIGIGSYYCNNRMLGFAGHFAPMPMSQVPRQLLTSLVPWYHIPLMTRSSTEEKVLSHRDISKDIGDVDLHCEV